MYSFLDKRICQEKDATHFTLEGSRKIYYNIPENLYEHFFNQLCSHVAQSETHSLYEMPTKYQHVVLDLTMEFFEKPVKAYSERFLLSLIYAVQRVIYEEITNLDTQTYQQMHCIVLEENQEPLISADGNFEYRLQLHFVMCFLEKEYLLTTWTKKLKASISKYIKLDNPLPCNWGQCINFGIYNDPVLVYGGINFVEEAKPLLYSRYFTYLDFEFSVLDDPNVVIEDVFNIEDMVIYPQTHISNAILFNQEKSYWLPLFCSRAYRVDISHPKEDPLAESFKNVDDASNYLNEEYSSKLSLSKFRSLILLWRNHLDKLQRSSKYIVEMSWWKDIGRALFSIVDGSESKEDECLEIWQEFLNGLNIETETLNDMWERFATNGVDNITEETVLYYINITTPYLYREWIKEDKIKKYVAAVVDTTDDNVAQAFYCRFPFDFVYTGKNDGWYYFKRTLNSHGYFHGYWVHDYECGHLFNHIRDSFKKSLSEHAEEILEEIGDKLVKKSRANNPLDALLTKLGSTAYKNTLEKTLRDFYSNHNFSNIADENQCITNNEDCLIEVTTKGHIWVRGGKPQDYCTKSTKKHFLRKRSAEKEKKVQDYFDRLFPDPDYQLYHKCMLAYMLIGVNNLYKLFFMLYGEHNSSKSQYAKFIGAAFGDYVINGQEGEMNFNPGKQNAAAAAPEKMRKKGTRAVFHHEWDSKTVIDSSKIRRESGGDRPTGRDLFAKSKEIKEFNQQYKSFGLANKYPPLNDPSVAATFLRLKVLKFETRFFPKMPNRIMKTYLEERALIPNDKTTKSRLIKLLSSSRLGEYAPPDPADQKICRIYPIDNTIEDQINDYAPYFLQMAVDNFTFLMEKGFPECSLINQWTYYYRTHCDFYYEFIDSMIEPFEGGKITQAAMYRIFKSWYAGNFPSCKVPSIQIFMQEMINKNLINTGEKIFIGYSIKQLITPEDMEELKE